MQPFLVTPDKLGNSVENGSIAAFFSGRVSAQCSSPLVWSRGHLSNN